MFMKKIKKLNYKRIALILIFTLAIIIRLYNYINCTFKEINCDEAMTALNANSIANNSSDIYGASFPIYFEAWLVSGQSALLTYLIAISIKILGFSIFTIRLPSLAVSIASIFVFDGLIKEIFNKNTNKYDIRLIMSFLLAINPWHIMQSCWALDCNLFPHIMLLAVYLLLKNINTNKKYYLYFSIIIFAISLYTYGIALYAIPIFLVMVMTYMLLNKKISQKELIFSFLIFIIISLPIIIMSIINIFNLNNIKIGKISIQNYIYSTRNNDMLIFSSNIPNTIIKNVICMFKLLFFNYDNLNWNAISTVGTIYLGSILFVIIALLNLRIKNKMDNLRYIILWILTSLIIGILINNININRLNIVWYPLIILNGYGIYIVIEEFKFNKILISIISILYILYFVFFTNKLNIIKYNKIWTWQNGIVEAMDYSINKLKENDILYITNSLLDTDKERVFIIYTLEKHNLLKKECFNKNILLEVYQQNNDIDEIKKLLEKNTQIKIINDNNITQDMNYIITSNNNILKYENEYKIIKFDNYTVLINNKNLIGGIDGQVTSN